jgi:hypothetical protein
MARCGHSTVTRVKSWYQLCAIRLRETGTMKIDVAGAHAALRIALSQAVRRGPAWFAKLMAGDAEATANTSGSNRDLSG